MAQIRTNFRQIVQKYRNTSSHGTTRRVQLDRRFPTKQSTVPISELELSFSDPLAHVSTRARTAAAHLVEVHPLLHCSYAILDGAHVVPNLQLQAELGGDDEEKPRVAMILAVSQLVERVLKYSQQCSTHRARVVLLQTTIRLDT